MSAHDIALTAHGALIAEVNATPKPGLVDMANTGAHSDMDRAMFIRSADALLPYFEAMTQSSMDNADRDEAEVFASLRAPGMEAEKAMYAATGGVNTHKGALFSLGILCAAAGRAEALNEPITVSTLCAASARMTRGICGRECGSGDTHGQRVFKKYGAFGVRGEAESGFASVAQYGYPVLKDALSRGLCENEAHILTLLSLMANVTDTNVLNRAGEEGSALVKAEAAKLINNFSLQGAKELDDLLIAKHISPGGSADLLAISIFLYRLCDKNNK
jgi:triphosphoribosyl-dephospho-CoA synthase